MNPRIGAFCFYDCWHELARLKCACIILHSDDGGPPARVGGHHLSLDDLVAPVFCTRRKTPGLYDQ
jgi:hypothetical protein